MLRLEGYVLRQARHCESLSDPTLFYVKTLQMRCPDRQVDVVPPWLASCGQQGHPQPTSQSGTTCNCMPAGAGKLRYIYTVWHMTEPDFWPDSMVSVKQLTCCNRLSAGLQEVSALGRFTELAGRFRSRPSEPECGEIYPCERHLILRYVIIAGDGSRRPWSS